MHARSTGKPYVVYRHSCRTQPATHKDKNKKLSLAKIRNEECLKCRRVLYSAAEDASLILVLQHSTGHRIPEYRNYFEYARYDSIVLFAIGQMRCVSFNVDPSQTLVISNVFRVFAIGQCAASMSFDVEHS